MMSTSANPKDSAAAEDAVRKCILLGEVTSSGALCDVLSFLAHATWRGELVVEHGKTTRSLFFDEGHVVAASSTAETERLGAVLVRCKALTPEQAEACAERAADRNLRFGEALVELGFIQREKLFSLMGKQVEAIFCGMAAVDSGQFFFFDGFDDADLSFRQRHSVDALLLDAIRKMDETRYFRSRIPTNDHVPVRMSVAFAPFSDPKGIFAAIDGTRNVSQLAESVGLAELEVTRALFQHVQTGHANIKPPRLQSRKTIEVYNDAIVVLLRELDAMDEGDNVRAALAKFATTDGSESFFADAKPADDGTLDVDETVAKIEGSAEPRVAEEKLGKWLYDYASYAVFLARPHLERRDVARASPSKRVSRRVAELLDPIAPTGDATLTPPELDVPAPRKRPRLALSIQFEDDTDGASSAGAPGAADLVPRAAISTLRMHRVTSALVPGLDPSRTARLAPVSAEALAAAHRTKRLPPVPATKLIPYAAPVSAPGPAVPASGAPKGVSMSTVTMVAVACVLLGAAVASRGRLFGIGGSAPDGVAPMVKASDLVVSSPVAKTSPAPEPSASADTGRTELVIACEPECVTIFIDGKKAPSVSEPIAVSAGGHDVVVVRPGYAQGFKRVTVVEGQSQAVAFPLAAKK